MKKEIPYCHGEPMQASYRYKSGGVIYRTFSCNFAGCQRKQEVEWMTIDEETAGQEILRRRLARGDIEKDGLLYTKRGEAK